MKFYKQTAAVEGDSFKQLQSDIESAIDTIPSNSVPVNQAEKLALKFNKLLALIGKNELYLRTQRAEIKTSTKVTKKIAYNTAEGSTVKQKEMEADANEDYLKAQEEYEVIDGKLKYLEIMYKVCDNYHVYFRQISK